MCVCTRSVRPPACRWRLYLADWGYNTADERAAALSLPGVRLLSRPQFIDLLARGGAALDPGKGAAGGQGK